LHRGKENRVIPSAELFVNNVSIHELNPSSWSCKLVVLFDFFTWWPRALDYPELAPFIQFPLKKRMHSITGWSDEVHIQPEFTFCMSRELFGVWTIQFTNEFFNHKSNKTEISIVDYPETYVIKPGRQTLVADILLHFIPDWMDVIVFYFFFSGGARSCL
jgi:hypothetical protein